jgi:large subunit ribosomal protein L9
MDRNYKLLGLYPVKIWLHPEVSVEITINIARSAEEAKIQEEKGEALIVKNDREHEASLAQEAIKKVEAEERARLEALAAAEPAAAAVEA